MKPGGQTEVECQEMHKHPEAGYRIVKRIGFLKNAAEMVRAHHERYDGTGYPHGLKGEEIPLGARLFMVADAYDALTSKRPHRSAVTYQDADKIIAKDDSHFDPSVVATFMAIPPEELRKIAKRFQDEDLSDRVEKDDPPQNILHSL